MNYTFFFSNFFYKKSTDSWVACIFHTFFTVHIFNFYEVVFYSMKLHLTRDEIDILNYPQRDMTSLNGQISI